MAHLKRVTDYIFEGDATDPKRFRQMIKFIVRGLVRYEPDAIVATGVSGLIVAPIVAFDMGLPLVVVRKDDDKTTHSMCKVEGTLSDRYAFVDDFFASGRTLARVWRRLTQEHAYHDLQPPTLAVVCGWQRAYSKNERREVCAYVPPDSDGYVAIGGTLFDVPVIGGRPSSD